MGFTLRVTQMEGAYPFQGGAGCLEDEASSNPRDALPPRPRLQLFLGYLGVPVRGENFELGFCYCSWSVC